MDLTGFQTHPRKAEAEAKVARKALARRLKLSPSQVLTEERLSPFKKVEEAEKELEATRIALDRGNMEAAQEDFAEIESSLDEVRDLIQLSEEVAHSHGERHQALEELLSDTRSQEPTVAPLLEEMITHYHPDVLRFSIRSGKAEAGQESIRESCNQASERLTSAQDALISSETAFSKGRLIEAGGLLERAGNEIGFARHQLSLIEDQHAALKETEDQNAKALIELRRRQQHLDSSIADGRTMMPTITQYRELAVALDHAEAEIGKVRPNPFAAQRLLTQQEEDLNAIEQGVESDWILHANAVTAVEKARAHLAQSDRVVNRAQTDQISDSIPLEKGMQCHAELAAHLAEVETVLQTDHADWPSIQEAMNATIQETINNRNLMEAELKAAQSAINELHKASQSLSELQGWRSRHHVKVDREAGWRSLRKAREALDRGDYAEANKDAQKAHRKATWALTEARRDERRAEAEAACRRREAARRRRERESFSFNSFSSGSSGSSGFGSSRSSGFGSSRSSSFGSSSGSSGFSSGSFSSGSGVSRSGW